MKLQISWILGICSLLGNVQCWDNDELEIFDLVEEINTNFYTLLGVSQDAALVEIRKAYRSLSLVLHPDKNDADDAEIKFRQLVSVYDVLRDAGKRARYDDVLENGLPDWRQAVYYYRRVRKMGLAEMSLILFVMVTVGQYIVAWAAYAERKYTAEQYLTMRLQKLHKKQKKGKYVGPALPETIVLDIPTPSVWNTLPFQVPRFLWFIVMMCPRSVRLIREVLAERRRRKEEEEQGSEEEEESWEKEVRGPRRRKAKFSVPELPEGTGAGQQAAPAVDESSAAPESRPPVVSGGLWTDDDLSELVRLVKKYPQGTPSRWEKIATAMSRSVAEVTHMARKAKEDGYRVSKAADDEEAQASDEEKQPRKVKTKGAAATGDEPAWGQQQQKALEAALIKFPKGGTHDRWEKIAKSVPGKSKEECMLRYKQLVELVRRKKAEPANGDEADAANS